MEVGKSVRRVDAFDKATGRAKYCDDLCDRSALVARVLHSTIANGVVKSIDTSAAEQIEGVTVFHAGTAKNFDDELVTAGGRVLNVVALGDSFDDAREKAYEACDLINFEGKQYRSDIGKRAAAGRAAWEN